MRSIIEKDINLIANNLKNDFSVFKNKTILFAGGGGFLGFYFIRIFNKILKDYNLHFKVIFLDNFTSSSKDFPKIADLDENIDFLNLDICSPSLLNIKYKLDYVIHAAGIASPYYYRQKPLETLDVSILGSKNLLELSRINNAKYCFFSSSEIYGDPDEKFVPIKESYRGNVSTTGPRSCYDEGKRVGETLCYIYREYHNVHTNIIRPFNIFGPGMYLNDYRVMSNFANNLLSDLPLNVYGNGKQTRTFCYISDAIEGFMRVFLFGKQGYSYNIGNDKPEINMLELSELFFKLSGKRKNIEISEYPSSYPGDEPNRRCPDITRSKNHLNYLPKVQLDSGIKNYLDWCLTEFKQK